MNKKLIIIFAGVLLLSLLILVIPFFIPHIKSITYDANTSSQFKLLRGDKSSCSCYEDSLGRKWFRLTNVNVDDNKFDNAKIVSDEFPNGVIVEMLSNNGFGGPFVSYSNGDFKSIESYYCTVWGLNIINRGLISYDDLKSGVRLSPYAVNSGSMFFRLEQPACKIVKTEDFKPSVMNGAGRYWLIFVLVSQIVVILFCMFFYSKTHMKRWAFLALTSSFLLAFMTFERPYRGMGGQLDTGDDVCYLSLAQNHLQYGDMFRGKSYISITRQNIEGCRGTPGTPLLLEVGIVLKSILSDETLKGEIGISKLRAMRVMSAFYGFLAVIFMFLSLHYLNKSSLNIVLAAGLLWGTSLSLWTFERCIFPHSSELFLFTAILFFIVLANVGRISTWWSLMVISALSGMLILVRVEYQVFLLTLPFFFIRSFNLSLSNIKKVIFNLATFLLLFTPFYIFYRYSMSHGCGYGAVGGKKFIKAIEQLYSSEVYHIFLKDITDMLVSFLDSGLFLYFAFVVMILMLFIKRFRSPWHHLTRAILICSSVFFAGILFMLNMLNIPPDGSEWQHRYFLKLYPLAFIAIAIFYSQARSRLWKIVVWSICLLSLIKQYVSYRQTIDHTICNFDPVFRFMTDTHLFFHGYDVKFYQNYALSVFLFSCAVSLLVILYAWHKKNLT